MAKKYRILLLLGIGTAAIIAGFVSIRRNTNTGVLLLGGDKYWIEQAAGAQNDETAKRYLHIVLSSTQYGANIADNAVSELDDEWQQRRLYLLLAEIAPNENWKKRFMQSADRYKGPPLGDFGSPGLGDSN